MKSFVFIKLERLCAVQVYQKQKLSLTNIYVDRKLTMIIIILRQTKEYYYSFFEERGFSVYSFHFKSIYHTQTTLER